MASIDRTNTASSFYRRRGKRWLDLVLCLAASVAWVPLLCGLVFLVRVRLGHPVLFRQPRPGLGGTPFVMVKFRTMTDARDARGELLPDEERLTRFGRWLRSTSLDELPELWNVLLGDMSLVGPRPLLTRYLDRYSPRQARRHEVLPGLTGWAQVNGRNAISWDDKFERDVEYVENCSLGLDVKILALTALKVLRRNDIAAEGHATAPEFYGKRTSEDFRKAA